MEITDTKKRNIAYKLKIGDVVKAKPVMNEGKLLHLDMDDKKVVRVNIIANVVDRFVSDGEKKYASLTLDDASAQIKLKSFGEDISKIKDFMQGDTLQVVGQVREYNSELYLTAEVVKKVDPKWLLVRKLETQKQKDSEPKTDLPLREIIIDKIKAGEKDNGVNIDQLIMEIEAAPDIINKEITKLLEGGVIYEPRPGKLRYLG